MRFVCRNCQKTYNVPSTDVDFVCQCNDFPVAVIPSVEDVPVVGDWVDYTGSGIELNPLQRGFADKLDGTRGQIEGMRLPNLTERGNVADVTRQRGVLTTTTFK